MAWVTMDLNEFNKLVGHCWLQKDSEAVRFRASYSPMDRMFTRSGVGVDDPNGWAPTFRASFEPPHQCIILDLPLADVRAACREMTRAAFERADLRAFETVGIDFAGKQMILRCCGSKWRITGVVVDGEKAEEDWEASLS